METRVLTLNESILPKTTTCRQCWNKANLDMAYYPPSGLDPRLRRYYCDSCKLSTYRLTWYENKDRDKYKPRRLV
jgi:hypothetical protein